MPCHASTSLGRAALDDDSEQAAPASTRTGLLVTHTASPTQLVPEDINTNARPAVSTQS